MNVSYRGATYMLNFWDAKGISYDIHMNLIKVGVMHFSIGPILFVH